MTMIERALVSGKPATVAYVLRDMTPADAQTADYAKVLFDDGGTAWLTMGDFRKQAPPVPVAATADAGPDTGYPVLDWMIKRGLPLDRDTYLYACYGDEIPDPMTPELEQDVPPVFRRTLDDGEPMEQKDVPPTPKKTERQIGVTYQSATDILDASELPLRDAIERELAPMHGRVRMSEVKAITERLMKRSRRYGPRRSFARSAIFGASHERCEGTWVRPARRALTGRARHW